MTYELSRAEGTGRLVFLHGYAVGMSKYDQPLSLERVHETAEIFMAELDAAIKEIEARIDYAQCEYCGTNDNLIWAPNPYAHEINDDDTEVWLCERCREELAADI